MNQTLSRTIITAGTTFLSVFALYVFGGEVLEGFAFTMLVGIVSGTYSTVFIASAIAIALSKNESNTPAAPAAPARSAADRPAVASAATPSAASRHPLMTGAARGRTCATTDVPARRS